MDHNRIIIVVILIVNHSKLTLFSSLQLSCSISSGLSVSSNTTSHLVLDAQVGDQIR